LASDPLSVRAPAAVRAQAACATLIEFRPALPLRNRHLQSLLGSLPPLARQARRRAAALLAVSQPLLLACGQGVRLQAFHSRAPGARRLAVLLHGWESSADSSSVLSLGGLLYQHGFDVLRLNLRDHGDSHHLNREIFHSCRLPEVIGALQAVAQLSAPIPLYLAGFSLGGNFMLRAAADVGLPGAVTGVVAISPVLDPAATLRALEQAPALYRRNLIRRWSRSLQRKQRAWPGVHDFSGLLPLADLRCMTASLVRGHTQFPDLEAYLQGYAITERRLAEVRVRCSLLLAEDDPLIPAADLARLAPSPRLRLWRSRYGGHCGFLQRWGSPSMADRFVLEQFESFG